MTTAEPITPQRLEISRQSTLPDAFGVRAIDRVCSRRVTPVSAGQRAHPYRQPMPEAVLPGWGRERYTINKLADRRVGHAKSCREFRYTRCGPFQ